MAGLQSFCHLKEHWFLVITNWFLKSRTIFNSKKSKVFIRKWKCSLEFWMKRITTCLCSSTLLAIRRIEAVEKIVAALYTYSTAMRSFFKRFMFYKYSTAMQSTFYSHSFLYKFRCTAFDNIDAF